MDYGRSIIDDIRTSTKCLQESKICEDVHRLSNADMETTTVSFETLKEKLHAIYTELDADLNRSKSVFISIKSS